MHQQYCVVYCDVHVDDFDANAHGVDVVYCVDEKMHQNKVVSDYQLIVLPIAAIVTCPRGKEAGSEVDSGCHIRQ